MNFSLFHLLFWFFSILPMCELLKPILGSGWKWYSKRSTEHDQVKWQPTKGETTHSSLKAIPETAFSQHKPKNLRWGRGCQREGRREGRWDAACNKHFPCAWSCAKDLHTHFPIYSSPPSSAGKRSICNAGDPVLIPGSGRSPGRGHSNPLQYSWASLVAQLVKKLPVMWESWVRSPGWEDHLEEGIATHSSILAWRIPMDRGALWAAAHGVTKSRTQLSD